MSHAKNKIEWCLKKAERELNNSGKHRGLIRIKPDIRSAKDHVSKAEHYLKASEFLKKGNFSDISASTIFYSMYHCLLAIAAKFGYESRNQECTFALICSLIEDGKIDFDKRVLDKIASIELKEAHGQQTSTEIREHYQYGVELSMRDDLYEEFLKLAKAAISRTKVILNE